MQAEEEKKLLDRLARVEGQIRGLRKMLEEERACTDVLTQLLAARSGLEQAGLLILDKHLEDCVLEGVDLEPSAQAQLRETLRLWSRHSAGV
ncbi:MAG TPA: metal-sensitive transcriptional regulator [Tepidiformaceae bacterium]|jgi:DNA-binding FrmR family transcriptional regulator